MCRLCERIRKEFPLKNVDIGPHGQGPGHATLIPRLRDFTLRHEPATGFSRLPVDGTLAANCMVKHLAVAVLILCGENE